MLRARSLLNRVLVSCSYVPISSGSRSPFMGRPAFLFIGEGKAWVTAEEEEKNEREGEKTSRVTGSFFSFMQVPSIL